MRKVKGLCCFLLFIIAVSLASCSPPSNTEVEEDIPVLPSGMLQMEENPILDYQIPLLYPSITVNRIAYSSDGDKIAILHGEKIPTEFRVIEESTKEVVYTGDVEKRSYNNSKNEYNGYVDFSEVTKEGEYYIECDVIGRSYSFGIQDNIYQDLFDEEIQQILEDVRGMQENTVQLTKEEQDELLIGTFLLLLSYELYSEVYVDSESNQVPDVLEAVAYIFKWFMEQQNEHEGEIEADSYLYAATLTKYSYLYQKYDNKSANSILNLADKIWRNAEKSTKEEKEDQKYRMLAVAELYRATGQYKYRNILKECIEEDKEGNYLAKVTYLCTKQRVDVNVCSRYMKELMEEVEDIADVVSSSPDLFVGGDVEAAEDMNQIIEDILLLSVVEYVITNLEYGKMIENQFHYFLGRNKESYNYIEEIKENYIWRAGFLMLMSEMMANW